MFVVDPVSAGKAMPTSAQVLGKFAAELTFANIPTAVVERAKNCIIDSTAVAIYGAKLPWSRMAVEYATRYGSGGPCSIIGSPDLRVHAPYAAFANGVLIASAEMDGGRIPSVGAHPATLLAPILATCEETKADGKTGIAAFVVACEVMFRIGLASRHSPEELGFHSPGLTGPYGTAVAAGRVLGLNAEQMTHALGIAGSLSSGLLAFTKAQNGGMVKRLHIGRAAESGVLAARLAAAGYSGPETVLDGKFSFLDVYCRDGDPKSFTRDLHKDWETLRICMKRYACHMNAHTPIQAIRELMSEHSFLGTDVAKVIVEGNKKLLSHHNIQEPSDITKAQYSVPFCVALALFRDPENPKSFDASVVDDAAIRAACRNVELRVLPSARTPKSTCVTVRLKNGREFVRDCESFKGMPDYPLSRDELRHKFMLLSVDIGEANAARICDRLERIDGEPAFSLV